MFKEYNKIYFPKNLKKNEKLSVYSISQLSSIIKDTSGLN